MVGAETPMRRTGILLLVLSSACGKAEFTCRFCNSDNDCLGGQSCHAQVCVGEGDDPNRCPPPGSSASTSSGATSGSTAASSNSSASSTSSSGSSSSSSGSSSSSSGSSSSSSGSS